MVGIPQVMFLQSLCYTPSPGRGPAHHALPKERISLHLGPQSPLGPSCLHPAPLHFNPHGWREGWWSPSCRHDSLQESVGLSPLRMSRDLGLHHGPRAPANSPWHRGSPGFPFHSCLGRGAGGFSLPKCATPVCRCKKRLQALGMNFTKKKPASRRHANLEMCFCLQ